MIRMYDDAFNPLQQFARPCVRSQGLHRLAPPTIGNSVCGGHPLSLKSRAVALYEKLGDAEGVARAQLLSEAPPTPAPAEAPGDEASAAQEAE